MNSKNTVANATSQCAHVSLKAIEARARRAANRVGLQAIKSRGAVGLTNQGGFMLADLYDNYVVAGRWFELTPDEVIEWCDDE